jgi:hypothetical protein
MAEPIRIRFLNALDPEEEEAGAPAPRAADLPTRLPPRALDDAIRGAYSAPPPPEPPFDPKEDVVNAPRRLGPNLEENLYFDPGSFERRWLVQGSPHAQFAAERERKEQLQDLGPSPPGGDVPFDPVGPKSIYNPHETSPHDVSGDIEDQRGMNRAQADLQAKFLRSRGAYNNDPNYEPTPPVSYNYQDLTKFPLTKAYPHFVGALKEDDLNSPEDNLAWVMEDQYLHPLKHQHNTPLDDPHQTNEYLKWAIEGGKDPEEEEHDYDLRGYYKAGGKLATPGGNPVHLPDTFKKPNHPTFSDESRYSGPGNEGGHWVTDNKGRYIAFRPGAANLVHHTPADLQEYFKKYEPGVQLIFPPGTPGVPEPEMSTFDQRFPRMEEPTPMEQYNERQRKKREGK